ncbi:3'(2'),5'-bisphosphate nucleotidase [Termitomyces sp. T112]|nr:3'(2'),5'-bisphosphate nucleotidase [Termitomyces sp. T112]
MATATATESVPIETAHEDMIHDAQLDYYGKRLATCSSDRTVKVFDVIDGEAQRSGSGHILKGHTGPVWQVAWAHPKFGHILASCSYDGKVLIWKEQQGQGSATGGWNKVKEHTLHTASVNSVSWAPHELGAILACASSDGKLSVLTFKNDGTWGADIFNGHAIGCNAVSWAPAIQPGSLIVPQTQSLPNQPAQPASLSSVKRFASAGCDNLVRIWGYRDDTQSWVEEETLEGHTDWVRDVAWAPNIGLPRSYIATASQDKTVFIWTKDSPTSPWVKSALDPSSTITSPTSTAPLPAGKFPDVVWRVSWSLAGNLLAVSCGDGKVTLWKENLKGVWESCSMFLPYATEKQVAIAAVRRACHLTSAVFNKLVKNETLTKDDKSPVTVGDYAAQAVISTILHRVFPADPIVGEEDATELREESGHGLRDRIIELANEALIGELGLGDNTEWGIGPGQEQTAEQILDAIDRGNYAGGRTGRMWTIDPIDGTKGFLRGEQYAVCLSLIIDAQVQVGVIGCPNLLSNPAHPDIGRGVIFVAVKGQGAEQITFNGDGGSFIPLRIPSIAATDISFLESVEVTHSSHSFNGRVSSLLNVSRNPIRMDSQAKYGCLARGEGAAYLRMPTGVGYREKIWDHAPGNILVEEAGGIVTDSRGQPLDFGFGRTLGENFGVVAAGKDVHALVLAAVQKAGQEEKAKA